MPLKFWAGEERYQREPAHDADRPSESSERRSAPSVLDFVVEKLREEFFHHGRLDFERLKCSFSGSLTPRTPR